MIQLIVTFAVIAEILGLFYLDRDAEARTSKALWIPVIWMLIVGSRQVSEWLRIYKGANVATRYTEGNLYDALTFAVLMLLGFLVLNHRSHKVLAFLRSNTPVILFLSYCAISVLWSDSPVVGFKRWVKAVGAFVMVLLILTDSDPRAAVRRFFSWIAFLLLPLSVLFIMVYPGLGTAYDSGEKVTYYIGVMTQKNELGVVCLICGLGSLGSFLTARGDREMPHRVGRMIAHSVVLVTALWLLKTSDSMTSLSTLVIAGTVMVMASRRWAIRRPSSLHAVVGGALALALFATFMDETGGLLRLIGRTATLTGRTEIWKAVLSFHTNPLVGTGYDSFWLGDRIEKVWRIIGYKGIAEAHNGYLEVYINLGSIGLLLLGWVILRGYRHALNGLRWDASAGGLRVAFVTAGLMYSLTEAGFRMMTPMWLAFLLELTCVPVSLRQDQRQRPESPVKEDALPRQRRLL